MLNGRTARVTASTQGIDIGSGKVIRLPNRAPGDTRTHPGMAGARIDAESSAARAHPA